MWHVLNRFIAKTTRRNEYMAAQKTAQEAPNGLGAKGFPWLFDGFPWRFHGFQVDSGGESALAR